MSSGGALRKQISKATNGPTNAKQRGDILTRIEVLENRFGVLHAQLTKVFAENEERLDHITRATNAVCAILGTDAVTAKVEEHHIEELESSVKNNDEALKEGLATGALIQLETVADNSVVVTTQKGKDGKQLYPSKVSLPIESYDPEVREVINGKKKGETVALPDGTSLTILDVFAHAPPQG